MPGVQAKFWSPERLESRPRRCPAFHGLPSLAGDGRQGARPLFSSFVNILWPSLMGTPTGMFDKHILLICVPKALEWGTDPTPAAEGQIKLKGPLTSPTGCFSAVVSQSVSKS